MKEKFSLFAGFSTFLRRTLRRLGFDLHRYPRNDGLGRLLSLLSSHSQYSFVDVGASVGQFGTELRSRGFKGPIISIEPVRSSFESLAKRSLRDRMWEVHQFALGDVCGEATIHISSNNAESSSLLEIEDLHVEAFPGSRTIGHEHVAVRTLDSLFNDQSIHSHLALKLDVQGFEQQVLEGARELFRNGRILAVQVEVSLVSLYTGAASQRGIQEWLESRGFELVYIRPGFSDPDWKLLQVDLFYFHFRSKGMPLDR